MTDKLVANERVVSQSDRTLWQCSGSMQIGCKLWHLVRSLAFSHTTLSTPDLIRSQNHLGILAAVSLRRLCTVDHLLTGRLVIRFLAC